MYIVREHYKQRPHDKVLYDHLIKYPRCAGFVGIALGKTASALTAIKHVMYDSFEIKCTLIIAPLEVAKTVWTDEIAKWDHLECFTSINMIIGSEVERRKAVTKRARLHIINIDQLAWLVAYWGYAWPYDMVVIDESSTIKNPKSERFKHFNVIAWPPSGRVLVKRLILLTGTPIGNGERDLWAQVYLLDGGARLGSEYEKFLNAYFIQDPYTRAWELRPAVGNQPACKDIIYKSISDICLSMESEDFADLPTYVYKTVKVPLPDKITKAYKDFERDLILNIGVNEDITVNNALALSAKLLQFTNGAIYHYENNVIDTGDDDEFLPPVQKTHIIHDLKLDALAEIIEENAGFNIMVFYNFKSDLIRLKKRFGGTSIKEKGAKEAWNAGKIKILYLHPKSAGHGLNLQFGGHIGVWFGLNWGMELYTQANGRLRRPGQKSKFVAIIQILCPGTIDYKVIDRVTGKVDTEKGMLKYIKALQKEYTKAV